MTMRIGIINYNAGNLGSISSALRALDLDFNILTEPQDIQDCESIIIPGVGAFEYGMDHLEESGLSDGIIKHFEAGKQLIGICLGMHLLASLGLEGNPRKGLNLIPGTVRRLENIDGGKVPHLGWDKVTSFDKSGISENEFYFAHSFYFDLDSNHTTSISGTFNWGLDSIPAQIEFNNCTGIQFHPEKSGKAGMNLLSSLFQRKF